MPRLHAFEGATLEEALARVTAEVGQDARITQAEKIRTGGVAGFFARERFEVTVELDDTPPTAAPQPDAAPQPRRERPLRAPRSLLDLVAEADEDEQPAPEPTAPAAQPVQPVPSTEGRSFQEVLRSIAADSGLLTVRTKASELDPAPVAPAPEPAAIEVPAETELAADTDLLDDTGVAEDFEPFEPYRRPAPVAAAPAAAAPVAATPAPTPASPVDDEVVDTLRSLGVPDHLLAATPAGTSIAQHLLRALEGIPTARPALARRGEVVVVVGDREIALEAAAHLAGQLGQDPEDVVLAAPDGAPIADADDAAQHATVWRTCRDPFVVAVCAPSGASGTRWARKVVEALDPVLVWAAVRADRKPEDVANWAHSFGRVDALAVGACADTSSPAAVLGTAIPVAVVEGRRATPAAWTALLAERFVP